MVHGWRGSWSATATRSGPGTFYPTLHRLEAEGLLMSAEQMVEGRAALAEDRAMLAELAREVLGGRARP
jgi:DNA-binding PadR family transcriptional regulator